LTRSAGAITAATVAAGVPLRSELVPSVALLGLFDVADYDALLTARIVERELSRRLPLARVDRYAPLGGKRPLALDGGRPALTLGPPERARKAELRTRHDLVVYLGNVLHDRDGLYADLYGVSDVEAERLRPSGFFVDGLGAEPGDRCRVAWYGVGVPFDLDAAAAERVRTGLASACRVSVRDEDSQRRLLAALGSEVTVTPHPAVLAARLFPADVLRKRRDYLSTMGWYPTESAPVLVEGGGERAGAAAEVARTAMELGAPVAVVGLDASSGQDELADAITPLLPGPPFRLPAELTLEDVTAAIAHARAFVGASAAADAVARAFGVPSKAATADVVELQERAGSELDAVAALAEDAWAARAAADGRNVPALLRALDHAEERYRALLRAYEQRGERLVEDRLRYAEIVEGLETAADGLPAEFVARQSELENQLEVASAAEAEARLELERARAARPG